MSLIVSQSGNTQFVRWSAGYNPCTSQGSSFDLHGPVTYVFGQEDVEAASSSKMYVSLLPASVKDTRPIRAFICVETHFLEEIST